MAKLKPFSGKMRQSGQICLNHSLVIKSFLEICLEAVLELKANVFEVKSESLVRLEMAFFTFLQIFE